MKKKLILCICLLLLTFSMHAFARTKSPFDGQEFYTQFNIWHEDSTIPSTNYHLGSIIPVGTKVTIKGLYPEYNVIDFVVFGQRKVFSITLRKVVSKVSLEQLFSRYFSKTDPIADGTQFFQFTAQEQECIKKGILKKGMSKDAVLMAYGYPPAHKTPTLESDRWLYWKAIKDVVLVEFEDEKVVNVSSDNSAKIYHGKG